MHRCLARRWPSSSGRLTHAAPASGSNDSDWGKLQPCARFGADSRDGKQCCHSVRDKGCSVLTVWSIASTSRHSAREEERRRLLHAGHPRNQMLWADGRSSRRVSHRFHRKGRSPVPVSTPKSPLPLQKSRSRSSPAKAPPQPQRGAFKAATLSPSIGGEAFRNSPNAGTASRSPLPLTTSGTPRPGCRISNRHKGQFQEKRGTEDSSESDTMGRQGEESAEVQEPFGQVPRGLGECTWSESAMSNHVNYALTFSVLSGSAFHCLPLTTPGATPVPPVIAPNS